MSKADILEKLVLANNQHQLDDSSTVVSLGTSKVRKLMDDDTDVDLHHEEPSAKNLNYVAQAILAAVAEGLDDLGITQEVTVVSKIEQHSESYRIKTKTITFKGGIATNVEESEEWTVI